MAKLNKLYNKQNRSTLVSNKIQTSHGKLFVINNKLTIHVGMFDALSRVLELYQAKKTDVNSLLVDLLLSPIAADEECLLKDMVAFIQPLATALDILQGEQVTIGCLLPTLYIILDEWQHLLDSEEHET